MIIHTFVANWVRVLGDKTDPNQWRYVALEEISLENHNNYRTKKRKQKSVIKRISSLFRLDPFIDGHSLLRVGERMSKSTELSEDAKHPIILPKKSHVTSLISLSAILTKKLPMPDVVLP